MSVIDDFPEARPHAGSLERPRANRPGRYRIDVDRRGSTAVEFSLLALPFLMLIFGVLQYFAFHITQSTMSDALYQSASNPEASLLLGDKASYKTILCQKTMFTSTCTANVKLELQPLSSVPTVATPITGTTFNAGSTNDVLVLRAATAVIQLVPLVPPITAKASVVFRRPS